MKPSMNGDSLGQAIRLSGNDKISTHKIPPHEEVKIVLSDYGNIERQTSGSSKVKISTVSKYDWEHKVYTGKIVAVHKNLNYLAYALKGREGGIVRVLNTYTSERMVLKGFDGSIQDLAFSYSESAYLACCDSRGNVHVYLIYNDGNDRSMQFDFITKFKSNGPMNIVCRVIWCPYIPDSDESLSTVSSSEDCGTLLFISYDTKGCMFKVDQCIKAGIAKEIDIETQDIPTIRISPHEQVITDASISPDGTAVATASKDGEVRFHQVYLPEREPAKILHTIVPYAGLSVNAICFLDNHKRNNDEAFWRFILTMGGPKNNVVKLWNCEKWSCLQTITFDSSADNMRLIGQTDFSSSHLVLADVYSRTLMVLDIQQHRNESRAGFTAVSEFLLTSPCLNIAVKDAYKKPLRPKTEETHPDIASEDESDGEPSERDDIGTFVDLYSVQPRALEELKIRYRESSANHTPMSSFNGENSSGLRDGLSDFQDMTPPSSRHSLLEGGDPDGRLSYHSSLSGAEKPVLLTPDAFTSPPPKSDVSSTLTNVTSMPPEPISDFPRPPVVQENSSSSSSASLEVNEIMDRAKDPDPGEISDDEEEEEEEEEGTIDEGSWHSTPLEKQAQNFFQVLAKKAIGHAVSNDSEDGVEKDEMNLASNGHEADDSSSCEIPAATRMGLQNLMLTDENKRLLDIQHEMKELKAVVFSQREQLNTMQASLFEEFMGSREKSANLHKQLQRIESTIVSRIDKQTNSQEKKLSLLTTEKQKQDKASQQLSSSLEKACKTKLDTIVAPSIMQALDPLKARILQEMTHRLIATESTLKESIQRLIKQQSTIDNISQATAACLQSTIQTAYKDAFTSIVIPTFEKTIQRSLEQVNTIFVNGVKEYVNNVENHVDKLRKKQEDGTDPVMQQLRQISQQLSEQKLTLSDSIKSEMASTKADLLKQMKVLVQSEVENAMKAHVNEINENVVTALRSRASTPTSVVSVEKIDTENRKRSIHQQIVRGQVDMAFQSALCACDIDLVLYVCESFEPTMLFSPSCPLQQPVLLSLIQQLSADFGTNTKLKVAYLEEAITHVESGHAGTAQHVPVVMKAVRDGATAFLSRNQGFPLSKNIRMIRMAAESFLKK
ncbi:DgyrCDS5830 [Dimorphilus gyrociliatus]|uniref:DgyrCDS5830 n=1 Tax=Dimorphilus gyrociliatus TaxID=2664684 RepID=A0A7I8VLV9_9ANNE|nr:DgyrCDS5830 [Dimorphilus gyrociliatus]